MSVQCYDFHRHYKQSMKSYYTALWTLTHMSTFSLHNDSAVHIRIMCVCAWRERERGRESERERERLCCRGKDAKWEPTCHLLWVLSSWVKGKDAWGQSRHLSLSPSPSLSPLVGSKRSVAWTTRYHQHLSSALPASLIQSEVFIN